MEQSIVLTPSDIDDIQEENDGEMFIDFIFCFKFWVRELNLNPQTIIHSFKKKSKLSLTLELGYFEVFVQNEFYETRKF